MIDHVSVRVQDFPRLLTFYREALAPIGYKVVMEYPGAVGLGADGKPDLWLMQSEVAINPTHVALVATREGIVAFHAAGLAAGGTDNGPPGLRADYHPTYYAAFLRDPEGNNIEVVCHEAPGAPKAAKAKATKPKKAAAKKPAMKMKAAAKKVTAKAVKKSAKPATKAKTKAKTKAETKAKTKAKAKKKR